jgi:DNA-binding CsgD family transcriptional regulator
MTDRSAEDPCPLDRLTAAEREVLILLARGHTAKTIAVSLGVSVAAVNERLRGARRRTGAGSSRELARRLAQQNRDEFSGLAAADAAAFRSGEPAPKGRWNRRRTLMIASTALAAAVALALGSQLAAPSPQAAPGRSGPEAAILARLSAGATPEDLARRLADEVRDEAWATRAEAGVRERYARTPGVARTVDTLSVTCAATLCEVIGRTGAAASSDDITGVLSDVQSGELSAALESFGLTTLSSAFTTDPADPARIAFVAYLERSAAK